MDPQEILEIKLVGKFITRFSIGDTWDMYFNDCFLVAQNIIFSDEDFLSKLIFENFQSSNFSTDKEHISKVALLTINMRETVIGVKIDELCNLKVEFENGNKMLIPTNNDIVDWQWCINETGKDPYLDYDIACFREGEIEIK